MLKTFFIVTFLLVMFQPARADITGKPFVVDGDTIAIAGQLIRLYAIDAPESEQTCGPPDRTWRCGQEAGFALAFFVASNWVTCVERGRALDGELAAVCFAGGIGGPDLARHQVAKGWALALAGSAEGYEAEQAAARSAGLGVWRAAFTPPWEWRRQHSR